MGDGKVDARESLNSPRPADYQSLPASPKSGITIRAILLGLLLIPANSFYVVRLERVLFGPYPATISLFANVVFALFVLVGLNRLLRRFLPRLAFSPGDLIVIYTMLAISTGLAGLDGVPSLNQFVSYSAWFGEGKGWQELFPSWLIVGDREALRGHFLGHSTFYTRSALHAWATPILCWTLFIVMLLFVANCINVLVRRQWADYERLTFPIVWLPLAMVDEGTGAAFFSNWLMWGGFLVAGGLNLWNGIAFLYPSLPSVPLGIQDLTRLFAAKPWSGIDWFPVTFYPMVIGLGFLLPLDLLFSCWFFFLFWKAQMVVSNAMAWDTTPDFPFIKEQGFGAVLGLFGAYLWSGRRTYAAILRRAIHPARSRDEASEAPVEGLSDRTALGGAVVGCILLLAFCVIAGMGLGLALAFLIIYLITLTVITRIRAELGPPVHDFHFIGPDNMIPRAIGSAALSHRDMALFTGSFAFTRAHRGDTMPVGLEGLQMARLRGLDARRMFAAVMIAVVFGTLSAFWAFEHQAYQLGAATRFGQGYGFSREAFSRLGSWLGGGLDRDPNGPALCAMAVGLATTAALFLLRLRFVGFPFHPIGYAISSSWSIHLVWLPLLIAWAIKKMTLRAGGLGSYRKILPFFLGLVLGDCVLGTFWGLVSVAFNIRTYSFFGE